MLTDAAVIDNRQEWATARDVQQRFMTPVREAPGAVYCSARCRQAHALGGDSFDFVPLPHGRLTLTVGDASGQGLAATLMIAHVQSSVRTTERPCCERSTGTRMTRRWWIATPPCS